MKKKSQNDYGKTALLAVSFGTSHPDADAAAIKPVESALQSVFKDLEVRRAFTSKKVVSKLASRGKYIPSPENALNVLAGEGFDNVIVQPLHFLKGHEYEKKVVAALEPLKHKFKRFVIGRPMLSDEKDLEDLADIAASLSEEAGGEFILFMGHGSDHSADSVYAELQKVLDKRKINALIATVEGNLVLDSVLPEIEKRAGRNGNIHLFPLMLVAGDHAKNDMAGEDESWKTLLEKYGYKVYTYLNGLGENLYFQQIVVKHVRESRKTIFPEKYEKMRESKKKSSC